MEKVITTLRNSQLSLILFAAVIQGWALYGLHLSIEHEHWPATSPAWLIALYSVTLLVPLSFQLLITHWQKPLTYAFIASIGIAVFYFGWHHGSVITGTHNKWSEDLQDAWPLLPIYALLWLHALPFLQCRLITDRWVPDYRLLFSVTWRNVLTLAEAAIFTGLFWALLALWAALFHMLDINFFKELFDEPIFVYPVTAITFGFALHLIGSLERWTEVVLEQILSVLKWLAVVAALILVLFTAALLFKLPTLVFTGTRAIGAAWLLWLIAVVVLFINAAFRDGTVERPYPQWLNKALRFCMPLLVIIAITAAYSLCIRTTEFGLTVYRLWGMLVALIALAYSLGYCLAAVGSGRWMARIESVNVVVALGLIVVMALMLTPVLSPYRLAADSQFERAKTWQPGTDGKSRSHLRLSSPLQYLRFDAGNYGRNRLVALSTDADKQLAERAITVLKQETRWQVQSTPDPRILDHLLIYPAGRTIDSTLLSTLQAELTDPKSPLHDMGATPQLIGLMIDLNADDVEEFILFINTRGHVYHHDNDRWKRIGEIMTSDYNLKNSDVEIALATGKLSTEALAWRDLHLGKYRFRFTPETTSLGMEDYGVIGAAK